MNAIENPLLTSYIESTPAMMADESFSIPVPETKDELSITNITAAYKRVMEEMNREDPFSQIRGLKTSATLSRLLSSAQYAIVHVLAEISYNILENGYQSLSSAVNPSAFLSLLNKYSSVDKGYVSMPNGLRLLLNLQESYFDCTFADVDGVFQWPDWPSIRISRVNGDAAITNTAYPEDAVKRILEVKSTIVSNVEVLDITEGILGATIDEMLDKESRIADVINMYSQDGRVSTSDGVTMLSTLRDQFIGGGRQAVMNLITNSLLKGSELSKASTPAERRLIIAKSPVNYSLPMANLSINYWDVASSILDGVASVAMFSGNLIVTVAAAIMKLVTLGYKLVVSKDADQLKATNRSKDFDRLTLSTPLCMFKGVKANLPSELRGLLQVYGSLVIYENTTTWALCVDNSDSTLYICYMYLSVSGHNRHAGSFSKLVEGELREYTIEPRVSGSGHNQYIPYKTFSWNENQDILRYDSNQMSYSFLYALCSSIIQLQVGYNNNKYLPIEEQVPYDREFVSTVQNVGSAQSYGVDYGGYVAERSSLQYILADVDALSRTGNDSYRTALLGQVFLSSCFHYGYYPADNVWDIFQQLWEQLGRDSNLTGWAYSGFVEHMFIQGWHAVVDLSSTFISNYDVPLLTSKTVDTIVAAAFLVTGVATVVVGGALAFSYGVAKPRLMEAQDRLGDLQRRRGALRNKGLTAITSPELRAIMNQMPIVMMQSSLWLTAYNVTGGPMLGALVTKASSVAGDLIGSLSSYINGENEKDNAGSPTVGVVPSINIEGASETDDVQGAIEDYNKESEDSFSKIFRSITGEKL